MMSDKLWYSLPISCVPPLFNYMCLITTIPTSRDRSISEGVPKILFPPLVSDISVFQCSFLGNNKASLAVLTPPGGHTMFTIIRTAPSKFHE